MNGMDNEQDFITQNCNLSIKSVLELKDAVDFGNNELPKNHDSSTNGARSDPIPVNNTVNVSREVKADDGDFSKWKIHGFIWCFGHLSMLLPPSGIEIHRL